MRYRFGEFELDGDSRELRIRGRVRPIQPKAFGVLEHLLRNRGRVVSKDELLATLWRDVSVSEGSLQRAVSLARSALGSDASLLRTIPRHGYRFTGAVEADRAEPGFVPRFARCDGIHIAYHTIGEGAVDLVIVPGWVFPMQAFVDHPAIEGWLERLSRLGRVILFDKRGTGLSDRVKTLPTLEDRASDLRAVLDETRSSSCVLLGVSEGGALSILFAASFPERVRGLVLAGSFARWTAAPDYPFGWPRESIEELRRYISSSWGAGKTMQAIIASRERDSGIAAWAARAERNGASPGAALDLLEMNLQVDVRPVLPTVSVPTVVLHAARDRLFPVENGRLLAAQVPGARLVEVDTDDHAFLFDGVEELREALGGLLRGSSPTPARFLATIAAIEARGTPNSSALDAVAARHGGLPTGAGGTWTFDGPQRAIRCAHALLAAAGMGGRAGIHAGEAYRAGGRLHGAGLEAARAIARASSPGEVRISSVVRDLIPGSDVPLEEREEVRLADGRELGTFACGPPGEIGER